MLWQQDQNHKALYHKFVTCTNKLKNVRTNSSQVYNLLQAGHPQQKSSQKRNNAYVPNSPISHGNGVIYPPQSQEEVQDCEEDDSNH